MRRAPFKPAAAHAPNWLHLLHSLAPRALLSPSPSRLLSASSQVNCHPEGLCEGAPHRPQVAPGSAGVLRGRKRDIWEGGHRVPGIIAFPRLVGPAALVSWTTVTTMDFLPTVLELLGNASRPKAQEGWASDGQSIVPVLRGGDLPPRGFGWAYMNVVPNATAGNGYGYRHGKWKLVVGSASCTQESCKIPMLYDLEADLGERSDVAAAHPDILKAIQHNFSEWHASVLHSRESESQCLPPRGFQRC